MHARFRSVYINVKYQGHQVKVKVTQEKGQTSVNDTFAGACIRLKVNVVFSFHVGLGY